MRQLSFGDCHRIIFRLEALGDPCDVRVDTGLNGAILSDVIGQTSGSDRSLSMATDCGCRRDKDEGRLLPERVGFSTFLGMTPRRFRAKVLSIRHLTKDVRELTLALIDPPTLAFLPGQSIAVTISENDSTSSFVRYYSLASLPSSSHQLVLLFNAGDHGKGAAFLLERSVGEELECSGPFGSFHLHDDSARDLLFVGTGTGIAPLWSMIASLLEQSCSQSMTLLWGLRSEPDIYYLEELQRWAERHQNFSFILTLSQPGENWGGKIGRVTNLLEEFPRVDHLAVYVCGNRKMVSEVAGLLQHKGACSIYRERHHEDM